ncbi:NAD(P)-binding protein [Thozetella sp. PMI_491]|nr:NAD(P)-binding protein [Thozetella sp. PMI_491]
MSLPTTMRALICEEKGKPLEVKIVPTPTAETGSVVVKVLASIVDKSIEHALSSPFMTYPTPYVPGPRAIGRVAAVSEDACALAEGQLVMLEPFIRGRDDPMTEIVFGIFEGLTPAAKRLAKTWRNGTFAEYVRSPLENTWALNEARLCGPPARNGLGYSTDDLLYLASQVVPYGGLRSLGLRAGERLVVAPATGSFSGAAVGIATAMGASVIAVGRNLVKLESLRSKYPSVTIVQISGNTEEDAAAIKQGGPVDAYLDLSPPAAAASTHVRSCFMALRQYGRACLMGLLSNDLAMPYQMAVWKNLTISGRYMYERQDVRELIAMAEAGVLKLGSAAKIEIVGKFGLYQIDTAFKTAKEHADAGKLCIINPQI